MQVGRVVGTLVATRKDERLVGAKLLVVRTMDPTFTEEQGYVVAVDTVHAGVGDKVLLVAGSSARLAQGMKDAPIDSAIVGVVDQVELQKLSPKACAVQLGIVRGTLVASQKDERLNGINLLVVQPIRPDGSSTWKLLIATDATSAGPGETVFWVKSKEAANPFAPLEVPTDATIVGIVDTINVEA